MPNTRGDCGLTAREFPYAQRPQLRQTIPFEWNITEVDDIFRTHLRAYSSDRWKHSRHFQSDVLVSREHGRAHGGVHQKEDALKRSSYPTQRIAANGRWRLLNRPLEHRLSSRSPWCERFQS